MAEGQIEFGGEITATAEQTDEQYLRDIRWRASADERVVSAAKAGDLARFARVLRKVLGRQSQTPSKSQLTPSLLQSLWSRHVFEGDPCGFVTEIRRHLTSKKAEAKRTASVTKIVERELECGGPCVEDPIALPAWMSVLREVNAQLKDDVLVTLWRRTLDATILCSMDGRKELEETVDQVLLVQGEVPWRSGLLFSDVRGAGQQRKAGQSLLREELESLTDGDGTPHARSLRRLPLTLAVFVRSTFAGESFGRPLWDRDSAARFQQLVERIASLCLDDGRTALSNGSSFAPASLMKTATKLAGLSKRIPAAQRLLSLPDDSLSSTKKSIRKAHKISRPKKTPQFDQEESPSSQSDWAELACLRNNWQRGADSCVVTHHESQPQICLTAFERPLIYGDWQTTVERDGKAVTSGGTWDCVCWFSDKDADYLELQSEGDGITFFRQVLLSRTDHWAFLAVGAIGRSQAEYSMTTRLPFADGVTTDACQWTRQLGMTQGKLKSQVYPLALDQQRVNNAHGKLSDDDACLTLQQTATGKAIYAPLVIDWSPDRRRSEAQWRRLTVAEDGSAVTADVAGGFRLRAGKHQWLFYRSFQPGETARTVLGHHTPNETIIAEFPTGGDVEPLVMVE